MSVGGMWGSNPRHSEPQSDALPTELRPPCCSFSKAGAKVVHFFDMCKFFDIFCVFFVKNFVMWENFRTFAARLSCAQVCISDRVHVF